MSAVLPRALAVLEHLVAKPDGEFLGDVADALDMPRSATHRILSELVDLGYLVQHPVDGRYSLGLRIVSQALRHLAKIPLVDLAKPTLDRLAELSGELARLSIPENGSLLWIAKTQGARSGLRYDPDAGREIKLARTSSGLAWLSTLPEQEAVHYIERQGFDDLENYGPDGVTTLEQALEVVARVREDGYCYTDSTFELGTATIAVPIAEPGQRGSGVLSIAGPSVRLTLERALTMVPHLIDAAEELAHLAPPPPPPPAVKEPKR
ncbi:IclR family transcriptional regulator [Salinibacterium sp. SYSU T00001]|uniref:IclR family transcriptional regulator n=1 Tax=Homoserinimonas sedimenticola TaxID=2986805 RepID=UPI0022358881|nr:IclR family transcriptional regulator [Salinibacterium sedimenticola]MCW4385479.1 IclR family transcriptional regulator [Salinibacterium sedimenticola]